MDLNFYSDLSGGCSQNAESEFLDPQTFSEYAEEEHKFAAAGDGYLTISGGGHSFLSAAQTFHTPSLGDEVFEIPPISLDPDSALTINDAISHFDLSTGSDGAGGPSGSRRLVRNPVPEVSDPSFASTFVNTGSPVLDPLSRGVMNHAGGAALLSSSALELGNSTGSHFSSSSPMTIDVQLDGISPGLLGSSQLTTVNRPELALGHSGQNVMPKAEAPEQPLSATPSPAGSLHDEDMDDFKRSVLVDSPMSLSSSSVLAQVSSHQFPQSSIYLAAARKDVDKQVALASVPAPGSARKGRKKKDPNEPQKPVSAYALFFRDTQAAIKGQNPNASFGEVSKIVASMWDSLADEQKQVYKKKTKVAKKEYLKALAAYKANQLSQSTSEEMDGTSSTPPSAPVPSAGHQAIHPPINLEENTITNICASNIILDVPEMVTSSHTGLNKAVGALPAQTITKIIIPKHMLQAGGQVVTMLPAGVRALHPTFIVSGVSRQPPPLQQMQTAPPPPRLQQMAPAPPPLQAKPREGSTTPGLPVSLIAAPPPPLQIKIVPASLQSSEALPVIVSSTVGVSSTGAAPAPPTSTTALQVVESTHAAGNQDEDEITEVVDSDEVFEDTALARKRLYDIIEVYTDGAEKCEDPKALLCQWMEDVMEVTESWETGTMKRVCLRAGCNKPAVESEDWDREYCSNECVATHCRDVFQTWCSIRNQTMGTVE